MTDRELIENVLQNKAAPRIPVGFWFHFLDDAETGNGLFDKTLLGRNIAGHREYLTVFKPDLVKIMSDGYFVYPLSHSLKELRSVKDLEHIEVINSSHEWIRDQVKLVEEVTKIKPDTFYFYNIFSAATTLRFMVGRHTLVNWLEHHREATLAAIDRINAGLKALSLAVIEKGGADGLYLSVQNPSQELLSDQFYLENISPGELDILESTNLAKGRSILHICGYEGIRNNLRLYRDYPASIFSWAVNVEKVSLGQGRQIFGGRPVLGGFPNTKGSIIESGDEKSIKGFTRDLLEESGPNGVIIGADCTIPKGIPYTNLEWVREAAKDYKSSSR
ncbi:MAG: uroporphyrinogen decarboxylase [Deltaproteobacteria bacterium]|nr:uroporphyrinogen decarboxylase [Deltaproteobacteria bacterium]